MATVVLGAVGAGIGAAFGDPALGFSIGVMLAGQLFPPKQARQERGRLDDLKVTGSGYGVPIPQIWGDMITGGNIIWVKKDANGNHLIEHVSSTSGGKGTKTPSTRSYSYTASFALYICRGPIYRVTKIWAEDRLIHDNGDSTSSEVQQIAIGTNTGGTYTVTFRGYTSASLAYNASAGLIQSTLEALPSIGPGNISVTGSFPTFQATFEGTLAGQDLPRMDMSDDTLTGGSGEGITTVQQGGTKFTIRIYDGDESQDPDELIENAQGGPGNAPAYRGTAYAVFEDFPLASWGNRIPAMKFEVETENGTVTVGDVLGDIFEQAGLSPGQMDLAAATAEVTGFTIADRTEVREAIRPILECYFLDLAEIDGTIRVVSRGGSSQVTVPAGHLGSYLWTGRNSNPQPKVVVQRAQDLELPYHLDFNYLDPNNRHQQASQGATRFTKTHIQNSLSVTVPLVFDRDAARQIAEKTLYQQWIERERFNFTLPWKYVLYAPGDVITIPVGGSSIRVRIVGQDVGLIGPVQFQAVLDDADILTQTVLGGLGETTSDVAIGRDTQIIAWSGTAIRDADTESLGFYVAVFSEDQDWNGAVVYISKDNGLTYQILDTITDGCVAGFATTILGPFEFTMLLDDTNSVTIDVETVRVPESCSQDELIAGVNGALLGDEVLQFRTVTPAGGSLYTLTNFYRGQRGTDTLTVEHEIGDRFVLLESGAIKRYELDDTFIGKTILLKAVGDQQSLTDVTPVSVTIDGDEFTTYAPVDGMSV